MSRAAGWLAGIALVVAAWFVLFLTPDDTARDAPFAVAAAVGEHAEGRNIAVTVTDLRLSEGISGTAQGGALWSADGTWFIVDLDAEARVSSEKRRTLQLSTLTFPDGTVYSASERPDSLRSAALIAGVPRSGALAFELPADLPGDSAVLTVGLTSDARLDSVITLQVHFDDVAEVVGATLPATEWVS